MQHVANEISNRLYNNFFKALTLKNMQLYVVYELFCVGCLSHLFLNILSAQSLFK